ncbi:pyrolysin [Auriscalpium vulgare]|uniref:Pyrolysin n=1 Tax=Auriscalpium vulgare TaxID=40419 RepID=A0ACB8RHS6_9AGAM|nr:pyrolysin [Auriscalpium vulgare]
MKTVGALVQLALAGYAIATIPVSNINRTTSFPIVPNKFIVEVDTTAHIPGKRASDSPHAHVLRALTERGVSFVVGHEYNAPGLFVGAAITLNPQDVHELAQTAGLKAIRPVVKIQTPKPVKAHVLSGPSDPQTPPDSESTHIMTGVDKLHAEGQFGAGINIGIIDTGVDYTHPALGGGFGAGYKIVGGYDFVGDAYDGSNSPVPDDDPLDQCVGHGTHVAGIIGADPSNPFNISGVAYQSSITAYRIFGCAGYTTDDIIVAALLRGAADSQDVLTLSLGGADGWTESSSSVVASRIAATGTVLTIAAGNDGAVGSWFTSSPGNGVNVISVASLDNTVVEIQNATVGGVEHPGISYYNLFPLPVPGSWPIYATSNSTTVADDACDALSDDTPDLSKFVTVVRRGTCDFTTKAANVAAKGGDVVLIYDDGSGFAPISAGNYTNTTMIQAADGQWLISQFAAGTNLTLSFPQSGGLTDLPNPTGGLISAYTSYGPTNDFYFKPAVAAPGGEIVSTFPVPMGSYALLSGTSMATPFVAGSAALLLAARGKDAAVGLAARTIFETTARTITTDLEDKGPLQTVTQQGAGLIDVYTAVHTETLVSPGELVLNDTANYKGDQSFTVKNTGNDTKQYTLTHVPAGTALTVQSGAIFPVDGPVPLTADAATVSLSTANFTLGPGDTQTVNAKITPPAGVDASTFPVFSGFIRVQTATETTHVSYLGLAAALKDARVVDNTNTTLGFALPTLIDSTGNPQTAPTNYTFNGTDFPVGVLRLAFGTQLLRFDLVEPDVTVSSSSAVRRDSDTASGRNVFSFPHDAPDAPADVAIVGPLLEVDFLPRNPNGTYSSVAFTDSFANGSSIPNGNYRILIRALTVTGDSSQEADFESWLSPIVGWQPSGYGDRLEILLT